MSSANLVDPIALIAIYNALLYLYLPADLPIYQLRGLL